MAKYVVFLGDPGAPNERELWPALDDVEEAKCIAKIRSKASRAFVWDEGSESVVVRFIKGEELPP
jgi:hypothetical protein